MLVERQLSADQALAAAAAFTAVDNPEANMSLQSPLKKVIAEFFIDGPLSVATVGERVDLDVFIQKDGDTSGVYLSALTDKFVLGGTQKTDGLWGFEAPVAGAQLSAGRSKIIELPEGTYKCRLDYKITAGAGTILGSVQNFRWGVKFTRSVAFLPQAVKPQDQLQV